MITGNHLNGAGCVRCSRETNGLKRRGQWLTNREVKALLPKGYKLVTQDKEISTASNKKVRITCNQHGEVGVSVSTLQAGKIPCEYCASSVRGLQRSADNKLKNQKALIRRLREIYGTEYSYSKVDYRGAHADVTLVCKVHGDFQALPSNLKYGSRVQTGVACPMCRKVTKEIKIKGRVYQCQGFESNAIRKLLRDGYSHDEFVTARKDIPVVSLCHTNGNHTHARHHPDIYVPSKNLLIEVKSPGTFGLQSSHISRDGIDLLKLIQAKAVAAKAQGFRYVVFVFKSASSREPIQLPKGWSTMEAARLQRWWELFCQG